MAYRRHWLTGELEEFDMEQEKKEFRKDILEIQEKYNDGRYEPTRSPSVWGTPMRSKALGVAPKDAARANEEAKAAGTGAHYDMKTGDAILESRSIRNKEMKRRGVFDKSGGFGDYTGASREYMGIDGCRYPGHMG